MNILAVTGRPCRHPLRQHAAPRTQLAAGHADEAFYLRELARQTGTAVGAAQRELEQLTAAGLVVREVRGNQVYFQANRQASIFPELQGLFAKTGDDNEVGGA
jgi:DNA-binding transcriptional ArsR family regulator